MDNYFPYIICLGLNIVAECFKNKAQSLYPVLVIYMYGICKYRVDFIGPTFIKQSSNFEHHTRNLNLWEVTFKYCE